MNDAVEAIIHDVHAHFSRLLQASRPGWVLERAVGKDAMQLQDRF